MCGLAGVLAACAEDEPPTQTPSPPGTPKEPGTVLIAAADVPVGGGVLVPGSVLVVQATPGNFKAFDARCPHKGAMVAAPDTTGTMTCPAHKAQFQVNDGSRLSGPADKGLTVIAIEVVDGQVRRVATQG